MAVSPEAGGQTLATAIRLSLIALSWRMASAVEASSSVQRARRRSHGQSGSATRRSGAGRKPGDQHQDSLEHLLRYGDEAGDTGSRGAFKSRSLGTKSSRLAGLSP
jgi:hypothetical protein